jgi:magnesium transporter
VLTSASFATSASQRECSENNTLNGSARQQTWQERLWGMAARRGGKPLKTDDLPDHDEDSNFVFSRRRTLTAKAALEPRLRCTEVDENGEPVITDGEFKKTELIARVSEGAA